MNAQMHDEAITQYSSALAIYPVIPPEVLVKRCKVYMAKRLWEDAIDDVTKVRHLCPEQVHFFLPRIVR